MVETQLSKEPYDFLANLAVANLVKKSPLYLDAEDEMHIVTFRKILELSLSQGRWWGEVPNIS